MPVTARSASVMIRCAFDRAPRVVVPPRFSAEAGISLAVLEIASAIARGLRAGAMCPEDVKAADRGERATGPKPWIGHLTWDILLEIPWSQLSGVFVLAQAAGVDMASGRSWSDYWKDIPAITWLIVIFALLVLAGGFTAMAVFAQGVTAEAIAALVTAVLGVVGTHIGHMAGRAQPPNRPDG